MNDITLAILAGGSSSRFGTPKRRVEWNGRWLLRELVDRWRPSVAEILLAGAPAEIAGDAERLAVRPVADSWPDCGPLSGIHASLTACRSDRLFVLPCDMPRAPVAAASLFSARADAGADCALLELCGIVVPVCGLYRRGLAAPIAEAVAAGVRKITRALEASRLSCINESDLMSVGLEPRHFASFNTPQELRELFT